MLLNSNGNMGVRAAFKGSGANSAERPRNPREMARIETPKRIRGTQDIFGDEQRRFAHVLDTFDRVRRLYCFQRRRDSRVRGDRRVRPLDGRDQRRRLEGDVHVRGSRRRFDHAASRVHRRHRPRVYHRGLAAICAAQAGHRGPGVPLRAPAKGPLPPVPPDRRRDHRRGRARGGCRAARPRRPAAPRARHRRRA
jgi:hypothetical protein